MCLTSVNRRPPPPSDTRSNSSLGDDGNLIIHGDNLHALKALLPRYAGRVKCIYIDPPYNTGNEGWAYNDNVNSPMHKAWQEKNAPIDGEDMERHDKWLNMMWPRLHLLRELLSDDGVIFVSIDDNEQHHLRMMMDEVFGAENFIASIAWRDRGSPPNDRPLANVHDWITIYGREESLLLRPRDPNDPSFSNPDNDPNGPWRLQQLEANARGGRWVDHLYYGIINPQTDETYYPGPRSNWRFNEERVREMITSGEILFGRDGTSAPRRKRYLKDIRDGLTWPSIWETDSHEAFPTNRNGSAELTEIFGEPSDFDTPKPVGLVKRIVSMSTEKNDIVLDSFAGSGTTAHAVLALNKEDGGNRKFILVECEDYADTITAERVRRVINGVPAAKDTALKDGLGGSFTYMTLGDPLDIDALLTGESLPSFETLAQWLLHTATGLSALPDELRGGASHETGLFYSTDTHNYHLLYNADIEWLRGNDGMLNDDKAHSISQEARDAHRQAVVFGPGKYMGQRDLTRMSITFAQLPFELQSRTIAPSRR